MKFDSDTLTLIILAMVAVILVTIDIRSEKARQEEREVSVTTFTEDEICRIKKSLQEHRDIHLKRCTTDPNTIEYKNCAYKAMEEFKQANRQTLLLMEEHNVLFHLAKCE